MKLTKFPIQLNNYIEEDELIYGNELIKRYILFFIPFFCISILEDCILNNLIFLLFYIPLKRYSGGIHFNNKYLCTLFSIISISIIPYIISNSHISFAVYLIFFIYCVLIIFTKGIFTNKNKRLLENELIMYKRYTLIILVIYFFIGLLCLYLKILNLFNVIFSVIFLLFFEATFCMFIHTD